MVLDPGRVFGLNLWREGAIILSNHLGYVRNATGRLNVTDRNHDGVSAGISHCGRTVDAGGINAGSRVASRAIHAKLRVRPDGICGVEPKVCVVIDGLWRKEDTAIGRFVSELYWYVTVLSDLVSKIESEVGDQHGYVAVWELIRCCIILDVGNVVVEVIIRVERGTSGTTRCLHRSIDRLAANDDRPHAGFVVHHFHEEGASRGT